MKKIRNHFIWTLALVVLGVGLFAQNCKTPADNKNKSVVTIADTLPWAQKMAETLMADYEKLWQIENRDKPKWTYTHGLVSLAYLKLWKKTGDARYYEYAKGYVDALIDENGIIKGYEIDKYNIDKINSGKILFIFYKETGDVRYKTAMDTLRKQLKDQPRTASGGFWHKKRYPHQMWLDGLYMGAPFYAQYGLEYNEPENFDDISYQILLIEEKTRDAKTGLLYHGWDESKQQRWSDPETGCSPNFWGRAMGWYSMALVDVLDFIPEDHEKRNEIITVIQRFVEAIVKVQDEETGLWYQVLDQGDREGNFLEGSVSSMFSYSMLKAVKKGYIDKSYLEYAFKAYEGIINNLIKTDEQGKITITPVCAVAGLGGNPYRDGSYDYYINERKRDNDPKATGPFIMASMLYDKMKK
ncbi:MAG: glycoside hydrolase family 88 protein [Bacteroidales bacterium]|nr:MAG: glycoside hydrolase family 88 protein [Bacteroidales bacterium]